MGVLYKKSRSSKYSRYFEQSEIFSKKYSKYSLSKREYIKTNIVLPEWEKGKAGVPLSWLPNHDDVTIDHSDSHTLVIGPTGSKKSRLVIMPVIRILGNAQAKESMIISDPKAELYNRTASYLQEQGYTIYVLNLRSPRFGDCWNPLDIPYNFYCNGEIDRACEFVNDIAENLIHNKKLTGDPFWEDSAGSLFFGLVLLLFKLCKEKNMNDSYIHLGNIVRLRNMLFANETKNILWNYARQDPIIESALIGTVETASETRGGILSTFDQKMRIFNIQPNLLGMLSKSSIDFKIISNSPTAIYLIMPDEKTGYHGLVSLFVKQSYEYIIFHAQNKKEQDGFHAGVLKQRLNYVLDEFSSLPTIRDFPAMITASRSRNIRFILVIQSINQLVQRYGEESETIQTNCNNWIFLTSRELPLLRNISELCGTCQESTKPVLSVAALQRLDKNSGEVLILAGRQKPFVTFLPDISRYDNDIYYERYLEQQEIKHISILDSGQLLAIFGNSQNKNFLKKPPMRVPTFEEFLRMKQEGEKTDHITGMLSDNVLKELLRKSVDSVVENEKLENSEMIGKEGTLND
jgi:type IV secretion system protein VirD4